METVRYEGRDEIMDGEAFLKKWIDFTRDYRIEKEGTKYKVEKIS